MTKIIEVAKFMEAWAPPQYQEDYDNTGLLVGNPNGAITNVLVTLDVTEAVVNEAINKGANLIIAHHPIIFKGLKKLNGKNYVEKTVIAAIKSDIAIYVSHTNLDHVDNGVNSMIAHKLGLLDAHILAPKKQILLKLSVFVPTEHADNLLQALHGAGAGTIGNYSNCSFSTQGIGSFKPSELAKPVIGTQNRQEYVKETKIEVLLPKPLKGDVLKAMVENHPYEEVAYYLQELENENQQVGAGMMGLLTEPLEPKQFLEHVKKSLNLSLIKYTSTYKKQIQKVAICGGAGSFLLEQAKIAGADAFVTADYKYHEFFDAEGELMIADVGHYESEHYTKELIHFQLSKKFTNFATLLSETETNPVKYYF